MGGRAIGARSANRVHHGHRGGMGYRNRERDRDLEPPQRSPFLDHPTLSTRLTDLNDITQNRTMPTNTGMAGSRPAKNG